MIKQRRAYEVDGKIFMKKAEAGDSVSAYAKTIAGKEKKDED